MSAFRRWLSFMRVVHGRAPLVITRPQTLGDIL